MALLEMYGLVLFLAPLHGSSCMHVATFACCIVVSLCYGGTRCVLGLSGGFFLHLLLLAYK